MPEPDQVAQTIATNLRGLRNRRRFTLDALAARSGVSRGMLIQVEQARTNPSIATLVRIADALGVSVAQLVEAADSPAIRLARSADAVALWHGRPGSVSTLLLGSDPPDAVELWEWQLAPGDAYDGEAHQPGTRELIFVLEGRLTLAVGREEAGAASGDAVLFAADRPHGYRNRGPDPVRFVMVVSQPTPWSHEAPDARRTDAAQPRLEDRG